MEVSPRALIGAGHVSREQQARAAAGGEMAAFTHPAGPNVAPSLVERALAMSARRAPAGQRLAGEVQSVAESRVGARLDEVRVHADSHAAGLARSIGANALTIGSEIYFAEGRYRPGTPEGDALIAHEATHAVQHGSAGDAVDADLMATWPTALGYFEIEMADRVAPARPGLEGHIRFFPAPNGPYSAEIGLVQAASVTNPSAGGLPWSFAGTAESERDILGTTGASGEPAGWHVDTTYADVAKTPSAPVSPSYPESVGFAPTHNEHGWLRSPTDTHPAQLYDYPGFAGGPIDYQFETVAQGMDNQTAYGALHWGFRIRAGAPTDEYMFSAPVPTPTFDIALERFRTFFTHEPVIVYFDTDRDTPGAAEAAKLTEVTTWMAAHSDVRLEIEGFADERGRVGYNRDLSQRRADMVAALLLGRGVDPTRIDSVIGRGETASFAAGAEGGQLQANRRVRVRFVRTATEMPSA
jgi:outer membrane protein OmpA-like peptidoglycan-associated protein